MPRFLPIVLLIAALLAPLANADDFELKKGDLPPLPEGAWTAVVIPDTQTYTTLRKGREENIKILDEMFAWMAESKAERNIKVAVHVGDMTSKNEPGKMKRDPGIRQHDLCTGYCASVAPL